MNNVYLSCMSIASKKAILRLPISNYSQVSTKRSLSYFNYCVICFFYILFFLFFTSSGKLRYLSLACALFLILSSSNMLSRLFFWSSFISLVSLQASCHAFLLACLCSFCSILSFLLILIIYFFGNMSICHYYLSFICIIFKKVFFSCLSIK